MSFLSHVVALTSEGEVFGWGRPLCLGLGDGGGAISSPKKLSVGSGSQITGVSCGYQGTLLVTSDGKLVAAGRNREGRFCAEGDFEVGFRRALEEEKGAAVLKAELVGRGRTAVLTRKSLLICGGKRPPRALELGRGLEAKDIAGSGSGLVVATAKGKLLFFPCSGEKGEVEEKEGEEMRVEKKEKSGGGDTEIGGVAISESGIVAAFFK